MMSVETMRSVNPKTVDRSTLVQRDSIRLEPAAAQDDRLRDFIRQIRNPYCYLDGKTVVQISFSTLIMNKLNLFARFYGQAIEPVIQ